MWTVSIANVIFKIVRVSADCNLGSAVDGLAWTQLFGVLLPYTG
jgi:hypothetical protein